jgi:L-aspartate oxidase
MVETLRSQFMPLGVEVEEDLAVVDLIVDGGACSGALALNPDGGPVQITAGAVVLAVGGASQAFPLSHTPGDITGDGYAMALRAGAELVNMEFMQYMMRDVGGRAPKVGGPYWTLNPKLVDINGDDILAECLPAGVTSEEVFLDRTIHYPFSSRDKSVWLDVAIERAVRAGRGGPHNGVFVDFSGIDIATAKLARPQHHPPASTLEPGDDVIEVAHSAHASNGGIRISENGETCVSGLYAVGETIAGPHGADRLGGGMLGACNVFGARTGRAAGLFSKAGERSSPDTAIERVLDRLAEIEENSTQGWSAVRDGLKQLTGGALVALRSEGGLANMLAGLDELRHGEPAQTGAANRTPPSREDHDSARSLVRHIETDNLLTVAETLARAALAREESRGSHFREDYPDRNDDEWDASILWRLTEAGLESERVKYRQDPDDANQFVS